MSQDGARDRYTGGSLAGGRYQLRGLLGEGGMASVHLAYDTALDRQVAIKTLHTELGREQSFRERFRREAQAVAKLSHPNIVSVFDTGEDTVSSGGHGAAPSGSAPMPYIVMEYVEGQPLGSVLHEDIRRYGAMPAEKALKVTADVLAALETSHEVGLVHRDIKPGNVMLTGRGVVKVMDFGIARAMRSGGASMTRTGMVVGTPQYLSPEQALGRAVDARSDLYSVGVMLFQLLTGRLPFEADEPLAIVYAHVQEEPATPSTINRSVTPAVDALIARALRKNPDERFPSAAAMRDECARAAGAGHAAAAPVIIGGGPAASGSGVASAVFPPTPAQSYPQSYPAGPQSPPPPSPPPAAPGPYQPGLYGAPGPVPAGQGHGGLPYGYPQGAGAFAPQPAPAYVYGASGASGASGTPTPPSYAVSPPPDQRGGGRGQSRGRKIMLVVAGVLAVPVAIGVVAAVTQAFGGGDGGESPRTGGTASSSAEPGGGTAIGADGAVLPPDRSRTIATSKCTDPFEDSTDPSKVRAPSLRYRDVLSVKECLRAAGWTWEVTEVDNPQWPKDAVVRQFPVEGAAVTPGSQEFSLEVSTGRSG
ncbi:protein kinase domain-containing protein [Streptomyces katsurahamanus]|uniref:non-specific serine/threonine protein kinase n=1 Tax=Streptomyces katsurahamanus TaxID=2577098 RepID=A0ABW9NSZ7_9ACTN|nr:protein kinase [Streptomyces katsurahamanus]MQS36427.1 serine/threonine protein kinase [Streptomyces katsurahamanus]